MSQHSMLMLLRVLYGPQMRWWWTQAEWQHGSLMDLVVLPLVPYLLWAIAYYVKVCSQ